MLENAITDGLLATIRLSTEPMVLSDPRQPDNPIVAVNQAFLDVTGYDEASVLGRNCRFLQGPRTDRDTVAKMRACLESGEGCVQWLVNYRRDGSMFWNLLFIAPVFDAQGKLAMFFANQHDLSGDVPLDMAEVHMGPAHMAQPMQDEFHALLRTIGEAQARDERLDPAGLEASLAGARHAVMALSRQMDTGPRV